MKINETIINNFLCFYKNEGLKEKTLSNYRYDFMAFVRYLNENKKDRIEDIDKLTIEGFKAFLNSQEGSKYSRYGLQDKLCSGTINKKLVAIKKFLEFVNYVYDVGMDYRQVRMNKVVYRYGDYFEITEIKEILKAIEKTEKYRINQLRFKLLITIGFVSGARIHELQQVKIEGIRNGKQKIIGKNSKERYIFFNDECKKLLEEYLEEQKKPLPRIGHRVKNNNDEGYVLIGHGYNNFGSPICKQAVCEMFKKLNKELDMNGKHITAHTLRHSFATYMADNNTNPFHLKELMGHTKLNTTAGYYHRNWSILEKQQNSVFSEIKF